MDLPQRVKEAGADPRLADQRRVGGDPGVRDHVLVLADQLQVRRVKHKLHSIVLRS